VVALMQKRQQQSTFSIGDRTTAEATAAHAQQHDTRIATNEAEESVNYKDNDTLSPDVNEEPTHAQHVMPMHEDNCNGAAAPEPSADAGCRDQPECATGKRKSNHNDNDAQSPDITDRERKIQRSTNVCSANKHARDDFCKQRDQCKKELRVINDRLQSLRQKWCRMYTNERNAADTAISTLSNRAEKLKHDIAVCEKRIEAFDHHLQTTQS
jgi:FtsZ-binding cell division protein ZapB